MIGCQSFYLIDKYKCKLLPGSCNAVAMGLWMVARTLLCDCYAVVGGCQNIALRLQCSCYAVVGGCQAFYMFLSDLIQEYWWLPECFYLIDMKNAKKLLCGCYGVWVVVMVFT